MGKKHGGKKAPKQQFTVDIDGIRVFGPGLRVDFDGMTIVVDPEKLSMGIDALTRLGLQEFITETSILTEAYADAKAAESSVDCAYEEENVIGWIKNTLMDIATRNAGEIKGAILVTDFFDKLGYGPEPDVLKDMREELSETTDPRPVEEPIKGNLEEPEPEKDTEPLPDLNAIRDEINAGKPEDPQPAGRPVDVTIVHFHGLPRDVMPLMPIL